jgi:hypothetical protein
MKMPLTEADYKDIWNWVYSTLWFKPSTRSADWPSIQTDKPFRKFSIDFLWRTGYDNELCSRFINNAIKAFVSITTKGEIIYALDWQHECFYYDPRDLTSELMLGNESSIPDISFIPDGDYYIFITKDLQNVWFGHPWERSVTLIGEKLILAAAESGVPMM